MDYRRFVSYIYRYDENEKMDNCGFVRVEVRQSLIRLVIHMQLSQMPEEECKVYGFVRGEDVLKGVYIGSGLVKFHNMDIRIQIQKEKIPEFDDFAGIVMKDSMGNYYATLWDEEEVDWSKFTEKTKQGEEEKITNNEEKVQQIEEIRESTKCEDETKAESQQLQMTQQSEKKYNWDEIQQKCPKVRPFEHSISRGNDEVFFRILPGQLHLLPKEYRYLARNSFLLHGYFNYRYLILGKVEERMLLGIPGAYYPQEENIGELFGFGHFLPATKESVHNGQFGYWGMWLD